MSDTKVHPDQQASASYGPSTTVVMTTQPTQPATLVHNPAILFREAPVQTKCIHCQSEVVTSTEYEAGMLTWASCFLFILIGWALPPFLWFGCCFIPFFTKHSKDVIHRCPDCKKVVGRFNKLA